jgi:hypothetical protein
MNIQEALNNYLGKNTRITSKDVGNGYTEVCDLDTGDCYQISMRDGLIERVDNTRSLNRRVTVETATGIKQLLNG